MEAKSKRAAQQHQDDNEKSNPDIEKGDLDQDQGQTKYIAASAEAASDEAFLVTFSPDDAENPLNWSKKLKWGITAAVSGTGFVRIMVSTVRLVLILTLLTC